MFNIAQKMQKHWLLKRRFGVRKRLRCPVIPLFFNGMTGVRIKLRTRAHGCTRQPLRSSHRCGSRHRIRTPVAGAGYVDHVSATTRCGDAIVRLLVGDDHDTVVGFTHRIEGTAEVGSTVRLAALPSRRAERNRAAVLRTPRRCEKV